MPIIQVLSARPRSGKSAIAAALAQGLAGQGKAVRLVRAGDSDDARADAEAFGEMLFASSTGAPVAAAAVTAAAGEIAIVELDAGATPIAAPAVVVCRDDPGAEDEALGKTLGARLLGTIATAVPSNRTDDVARALTDAGLRPLAVLPEDRGLAAPSVEDIRHALAADVLYEGENLREAIADVVVAPVYTDGAKLHMARFPATKAVLTPSYKTDLLLAAIEAAADCVIVTGGHHPSHYVVDRVQGMATTLLLAQQQTPAAVSALSGVWGASPFSGGAKAAAAAALLGPRLDWQGLLKKLD